MRGSEVSAAAGACVPRLQTKARAIDDRFELTLDEKDVYGFHDDFDLVALL